MTALRVLHVDDEPDIREVVEMALTLDPSFTVQSCSSGRDALEAAATWSPDVILLDVMMPEMDGPTTLSRLRESPTTSDIPVVFMTARAQPRELEHFVSLGAQGVIAKPFDPMTLAACLRNHIRAPGQESCRREKFLKRLRIEALALGRLRILLQEDADKAGTLKRISAIAHSLAGAGGVFGLVAVSNTASALEGAVFEAINTGNGDVGDIMDALDSLILCADKSR